MPTIEYGITHRFGRPYSAGKVERAAGRLAWRATFTRIAFTMMAFQGTYLDRQDSGIRVVVELHKTCIYNPSGISPMCAAPSTILVVEDDAIVRMLIVDVLEELEFSVVEAADAEEALKVVENASQVIDLMMTDVGLPDMDGKQLATKVRELRPALPILFASGYAENIDVPVGMQVIAKPFSIDQLRDKVKSMLPA
jgi:CheY-like chemotaxis protein